MAVTRSSSTRKDVWRVKSLRSTFGPQCLGHIATAPANGFGSSLRDSTSKTYVSPAVDRARLTSQGGNNSPGPIYKHAPAIGVQHQSIAPTQPILGFPMAKRPGLSTSTGFPGPGAYHRNFSDGPAHAIHDSTKLNMPRVRFGNALREATQLIFISKEHDKTGNGGDSPGPNAYNTGSSIGKKAKLSTERSSSAPKIGTTQRFRRQTGSHRSMPGPGQYSCPAVTIESHQASLPKIGFTRANRDACKKVFISPEHDRASFGEHSPGPGTASPVHAVGKQTVSRARTAPTWSFGSGKRSPITGIAGPGPGEYFA